VDDQGENRVAAGTKNWTVLDFSQKTAPVQTCKGDTAPAELYWKVGSGGKGGLELIQGPGVEKLLVYRKGQRGVTAGRQT